MSSRAGEQETDFGRRAGCLGSLEEIGNREIYVDVVGQYIQNWNGGGRDLIKVSREVKVGRQVQHEE